MKYRTIIFLSLVGLLFACKPEIDEFDASAGSADFSNYISVGNSLTAGYADGALYASGQENSFPSIMAQQFKTVGGGEFVQPVVNSEYGVLPGKMVLGYFGKTPVAPDPEIVKIASEKLGLEPTTENALDIANADPEKSLENWINRLKEEDIEITEENIFIAAAWYRFSKR